MALFDVMPGMLAAKAIRERTDTIMLAFSLGKDSLCMWVRMRKLFPNIYPFYLQVVPGIKFIDRELEYYERFFDTKILRGLQPVGHDWIRQGVCGMPVVRDRVRAAFFPPLTHDSVYDALRQKAGLPPDTWIAIGQRVTDNLDMAAMFESMGPIDEEHYKFYPIYDITKKRALIELKRASVKLPVDYRLWGKSWDALFRRFTAPIKQHFPDDYQTLLSYFPLIEADVKRWEFYAQS